jgi:hypothetical protein
MVFCRKILKDLNGLAIELIAEEYSLDKEATSYNDILDVYQLALKNYAFTEAINRHGLPPTFQI